MDIVCLSSPNNLFINRFFSEFRQGLKLIETPRNDLISIVRKVSKPFLSGSLQIFVKLFSRLRLCTVLGYSCC